ncbi:MAG: protein kinase [Candidatus Binatia bacterium]
MVEDDKTRVQLGASGGTGTKDREISNKYEVLDLLGQGGMGTVYKVRHTRLDSVLALKILQHTFVEGGDAVARFYREARVMARLKHPNIAQVLDIDRDEALNSYYFVMEYIEGKTLRQHLRERGALPITEVLDIAQQVASALAYAHEQVPPVIHRDIKPSNIMIEANSQRVVVMDFGIAKELVDDADVTKTGAVMGTMQYCAPEQMRREPLDGGADIYALGMVMYEAYTGESFFSGMNETTIIGRVLYDPQENLPEFPETTAPAFTALVTKAITKDRKQRYQRAADFLRDLEACRATLDESATLVMPEATRQRTLNTVETVDNTSPTKTPARKTTPTAETRNEKTGAEPVRGRGKKETVTPRKLKTPEPQAKTPSLPTKERSTTSAAAVAQAEDDDDKWSIGGEERTAKMPPPPQKSVPTETPPSRRSLFPFVLAGFVIFGGLAIFAWLRPSSPPPPPLAAPTITRAEPRESALSVLEGEEITFVAEAQGAAPLRYEWILEGKMVGQDGMWVYRPAIGERSKTPKTVKVQISDRQGQVAERHWQVQVTYVSKAPQLHAVTPKKGKFEIVSGTTQEFRFDVVDPDDEPLTYSWTVNGQAAGTQSTLNWQAEKVGKYQIRAEATDPAGLTVSNEWQVAVAAPPPEPPKDIAVPQNAPPQMSQISPKNAVVVAPEGKVVTFSANATDPDGDRLIYDWTVDGKKVASTSEQTTLTWRATGAGNHRVRAVVSDVAGLAVVQEWSVAVVPVTAAEQDTLANTAPQITRMTPSETSVRTFDGESVSFSAAATDPEGDALTYEWFVDGKKSGQGESFSFAASGVGNRQVELRVTDSHGLKLSTQWNVQVAARPAEPRIVMFTPHQKRYSLYPHMARFFGVTVEVPGQVEPDLTYEWKVNGKRVARGPVFEFKDQPVGAHEIVMTATTAAGQKVSQQWAVEVRKDEGMYEPTWSPRLELSDLINTVSVDRKQVVVTGTLRNTDSERQADNVIVWVTAVNTGGQEVARQLALPDGQPLKPGQTTTFRVPLANHPDATDFRVEVISK